MGFYDKDADFPVYTLSDVEENVEKYVQYYIGLLKSTNITKHEILSRVTGRARSLDTYLIQFSATESEAQPSEFLAAFIECQNGLSCYNLIGSYPQGDKEAQAEIYAALDSFRANGPAGTIYQRFYDERIPFQFLYLEDKGEIVINVAGENQLEMSNSKIGLAIYSQYLSNAQNKETLLDAIANEMPHTSGVELRGARRESKSGGIDWVVDGTP